MIWFEHIDERGLLRKYIETALHGVTKRESEIIKRYYGIRQESAETLQEIAVSYGITPSRVRQIKERGMAKLRRSTVTLPRPESLSPWFDPLNHQCMKCDATGFLYGNQTEIRLLSGLILRRFRRMTCDGCRGSGSVKLDLFERVKASRAA